MGKGKGLSRRPTALPPSLQLPDSSTQTDNAPAAEEPDSPLPDALLELDDTTSVLDDGRVSLNLDSKLAQVFAKLIEASEDEDDAFEPPPAYSTISDLDSWNLPLNIVIQIVGSRGDVQPFVALGQELQRHGHRVRLATHSVFKQFVEGAGLEFYSVGGDPAELMAYMVKNPGLLPRMKALREGDVSKNRQMIREILEGCWASCILPSDSGDPFVANAIIANPPSFAHIHCAQALGIPLHIMFTMPWSPTRAFPHPLANIRNSSTDPKLANYISYGMVQLLTWNGIGDIVQSWRKSIDLEPIPMSEAPFLMETLQIPHTYCWSPALVPKPKDWGKHIDVCGFLLRDSAPYTVPVDLEEFLKSGPTPIYIGFGSIVIENPEKFLQILLAAVEECGVRAIISKGWSNLESKDVDENVFFLGECPHEWLFQQVSVVVHHGGAGTTASGLVNGRPTVVVPFFGDQPFWGSVVAASRAGPPPISHKKLNSKNLSNSIRFCLREETQQAAKGVAEKMFDELGVKAAVHSFHRHLPVNDMGCDLIKGLPATWVYRRSKNYLKISGAAAEILIQAQRIRADDLRLYKPKPFTIENRRWDFLTSSLAVSMEVSYDLLAALSGFWRNPRAIRKQKEKERALSRASSHQTEIAAENDPGEGSSKQFAKMAGASAMSISHITGIVIKGSLVDIPVAVAEGLRNTPKLYGQEVPDHAAVTDWKSGITVAGTTFVHQMAQGLTDLVVQPAKGLAREGVIGFGKGIGKGALQTATKPTAACMGLIGYTGQGIYKSIYSAVHSKTKKSVASAQRVQDKYFIRAIGTDISKGQVVDEFDRLCRRRLKPEFGRSSGGLTPTSVSRTASFASTHSQPPSPALPILTDNQTTSPAYTAPACDSAPSRESR
ncbi:uncharacterized protein Z520_03754 [Fonsecaea multimorphosa CBS 102226]|uniref:Uncharacterized protein n=1 Tax=Fonsecaea multimorphosa CBS 102226 TaxID=1442371 RepID=A0A0D2KTH7_9EURO|nr:uncharacterized protein Z520_03754 [Fonsecaea multimorphosa CBS 102226]KIY00069.1 hypothetical protein Z520_03754 [Fonsecaea multimorphosa CBS 102226]OAL27268.1 hypothetical protein AYO22_03543 [Fonsecaea multimorphosa]